MKVRIQWINQEKQARKDSEKENTETGEADGDEDPLEEMLSSTNIVTLLRSVVVGNSTQLIMCRSLFIRPLPNICAPYVPLKKNNRL